MQNENELTTNEEDNTFKPFGFVRAFINNFLFSLKRIHGNPWILMSDGFIIPRPKSISLRHLSDQGWAHRRFRQVRGIQYQQALARRNMQEVQNILNEHHMDNEHFAQVPG